METYTAQSQTAVAAYFSSTHKEWDIVFMYVLFYDSPWKNRSFTM